MGFLSRLFGRVQEEPLARPERDPPRRPVEAPEPSPPAEVLAEPDAAPEEPEEPVDEAPRPDVATELPPSAEPEGEDAEPDEANVSRDVGAGPASFAAPLHAQPAPAATAEPEPEPEPDSAPGLPAELSLTLDEATAALRGAGSDGIRIGFISREYLRAPDDERAAARRKLVSVLTEQLRARALLAEGGTFELREEPTLAKTRSG